MHLQHLKVPLVPLNLFNIINYVTTGVIEWLTYGLKDLLVLLFGIKDMMQFLVANIISSNSCSPSVTHSLSHSVTLCDK